MGVLDNVRALKDQARNSAAPKSSEVTKSFFSSLPGILAALAAFITAMISLAQSCTSANKAVLERMDKVTAQCEATVKVEKDAREAAIRDVYEKNQKAIDENFKTRELAFEYYRKLETRVYDLEPGPFGKKKKPNP